MGCCEYSNWSPRFNKTVRIDDWIRDCPFPRFLLSEATKQTCFCCYYFVVVDLLLLTLLFPRTQITDAAPACVVLLLGTDEQHNTDWKMWIPRATWQTVAWIGCRGTIACPPRSPDWTPQNFSASLYEIRARITEAVATVDVDVIHRICSWHMCCVARGNHIEHLWISVDKLQDMLRFVIYITIL